MKTVPLALAILLSAGTANAATFFSGYLSSSQEVPTNSSTATGYGIIELSTDMNMIKVDLSWTGLTAPASAGHIHCCTLPGSNIRVAIDLAPSAAVTGSTSGTFNLTADGTFTNGFINANGGSVGSARTAFLAGLTSGQAYFNVHNANFPGGEIRAQITAVPEPATWALLISGFGLVGAAARRRTAVAA